MDGFGRTCGQAEGHRRREAGISCTDKFITNNGRKCILLSVEMKKGKNITAMGEQIDKQINEFKQSLPKDVTMFTITNQIKVVGDLQLMTAPLSCPSASARIPRWQPPT